MRLVDLVWMALILGGAGWLLWHFLWQKRGSCPGCAHGTNPRRR